MAMIDKVKVALRITHTYLDNDINETIATAQAEMVRAGVSQTVVSTNNDLVQMAIKTYCLYIYSNDDKMAEGYFKSWQYQLDNIRKSS